MASKMGGRQQVSKDPNQVIQRHSKFLIEPGPYGPDLVSQIRSLPYTTIIYV